MTEHEKKLKVYIIGKIETSEKKVLLRCILRFRNTKKYLSEKGYQVVNPIETLMNKRQPEEKAARKNLKDLAGCNAVFIMPCAGTQIENNIEVKVALNLGMTIIHSF